jgi:hypothetical protein
VPSKGRPQKRLKQKPPTLALAETPRAHDAASPASDGTSGHAHPRVRRPPPYIRPIAHAGSVAVWLVDGSYVRATIDQDFGAYGHHYSNPPIPRQELWLDVESLDEEHLTIVRRTLIERRLMARGMDYEAARTVAVAEERKQQIRD